MSGTGRYAKPRHPSLSAGVPDTRGFRVAGVKRGATFLHGCTLMG